MEKQLTHIDKNNNPRMVDVSHKNSSQRMAIAQTTVRLPAEVKAALIDGEIKSKKGPVFQTAVIAGVMAAKKTHELIPFCHPINIENCKINIEVSDSGDLSITCECKITAKTGVEMEALTGASVAALTVYDMCKAMSHEIVIEETKLIHKSGGKSDFSNKPT
ncbi:cyclic pyranopterin monophosphate synthase MoaC [Marinicella litoralis]|uniref:cyclic pyranopterin monophosphate synthase n=1 Tax=Marinicella litoralis TaxID=644220 RepID=A0A4R6XQ58_9GAMM|nr:cyclic pyranopterin monophosphate synthase MoaC [Marinicella litoralis]TDR18368.1 cyclic pyranopterin monophosphate synthase subunit MoaC [Marinicella litoralis]